jgi:hypothetical protein
MRAMMLTPFVVKANGVVKSHPTAISKAARGTVRRTNITVCGENMRDLAGH